MKLDQTAQKDLSLRAEDAEHVVGGRMLRMLRMLPIRKTPQTELHAARRNASRR